MNVAESQQHSVQIAVRNAVAMYGGRPAVGFLGKMQSFDETYDRSMRLATALENLGLGPGHRVGILASNGPWFFELYFASCDTGIVEMPINVRFTLDELQRYLEPMPPDVIIASAEYVSTAEAIQSRLPAVRHLIGIGDTHGLSLDYERLLAGVSPFERTLRDTSEVILISSTSGTSGNAKAVAHSQSTTASGYLPLVECFGVDESSHIVTGLSMYFATAYSGWTMSFMAGAQQTMLPAFDPIAYVDLVEEVRGTHAFLGPTPVYFIMDSGTDLRRLSCLRYLSMGGAACDPSRLSALTSELGNRVAIQFGMTELAYGTALLAESFLSSEGQLLPSHSSIGRTLGDLKARLVDDNGETLAPGLQSAGDLELQGSAVSSGYLSDVNANREAFHEGWFRTGDVARTDPDGNIYILDRRKDLIVSGGINIAPLEIEQTIAAHPAVLAAGVCGIPDETYGESVHAEVVVRQGSSVSEAEIVAWCRDRMASVKKPRSVSFVEELPFSSTGKLLRRELRNRATDHESSGDNAHY